jgi:hypothetical protein
MGREHVRIVGQLQRRGVVQRGDDVTVVNVQRPRERQVSGFRQSMRLLGLIAVLGVGVAVLLERGEPGFNNGIIVMPLAFFAYVLAAPVAVVYTAIRDGILSALGVLFLLVPGIAGMALLVGAALGVVRI